MTHRNAPPMPTLLTAAILALALGGAAWATQTRVSLSSSLDLTQGWPEGARVSPDGTVSPGLGFSDPVDLPAIPMCAVACGADVFVGTAPMGEVVRFARGAAEVLHRFDAPMVTALAAAADGRSLLVGTSTPARVYRLPLDGGDPVLLAEPGGDYVWALAPAASDLWVAVGSPARLVKVAGGKATTVLEPPAKHARCLLVDGDAVWVGTSGPAGLYRVDAAGSRCAAAFSEEEVVAMAAPSPGELLLAVNQKAAAPPSTGEGAKASGEPGQAVLYRMASGAPSAAARFDQPVSAAAAWSGGLLAGLKDGRLFSWKDGVLAYEARWENSPVAGLALSGGGPCVVTAAPPAVRMSGGKGRSSYAGPVIDMEAPARLGRTTLEGKGGRLLLRSGNTPSPGPFWSPWLEAGAAGGAPPARYAQWKVELSGGGSVDLVSLAYRAANRPPAFSSAQVQPPGRVQVKMPTQLGDHLVREVQDRDTVFPSLAQSLAGDVPPQTYYLQGYRTVSWKVGDPDGDDVRVDVDVRPAEGTTWYELARDVTDAYFVFDARSLPDGAYALRLTARDDASNPEGDALRATLDLPLMRVDNTPPDLALKQERPGRLAIEARDASGMGAVRASIDGKPWITPERISGEEGGTEARYALDYPSSGAHWIVVQAVDPFRNLATGGWLTR